MTWVQLSISAVGCVGQLALALVALRRSALSNLALLFALLFLDIFTWNLASLVLELPGLDPSDQPMWSWLDHGASPLTAPLALEFVLAFIGQQRRFSRLRALWWIPFILISLLPALGFWYPVAREWDQSGRWAAALTICLIPAMVFALILLISHLRRVTDAPERARTRLLLSAIALGTSLGLTDLLSNFIHELPSLGALGFLAAGAMAMFAAMRQRLLVTELTFESAATAVAVAAASVVAYFALFRLAASHDALLVLGLALITVTVMAVIRQLARTAAARRERTMQLATLGRFAAQMAHDFKNPLAALKGAAQFIKEDLRSEEAGGQREAFVDLMLEQIRRLGETIDSYQRLARVEPLLGKVELNGMVREVLALEGLAAGKRISIHAELAEGLPSCSADGSLLANALQNLIHNACEAIAGNGSVTVRTGFPRPSEPPGVVVSVEDTGVGMDARTREHAFDEFFTTKPTGSGLGLSFVRRVVEAHGGLVSIASQQGRGTVVRIRLPIG